MRTKWQSKLFVHLLVIGIALLGWSPTVAQHRGDNLGFQGADLVNRSGVKASAMGGAYVSMSGELDALFWNPAGLAGIQGIQFTANYSASNRLWRESQAYRPNRQLITMAFILDGLYQPNPDFNGWLDNEAFFEDSTYIVNEPLLGEDNYSEKAADWQKEIDGSGLNNIAGALPFNFAGKSFVVAAGYSRRVSVTNYDRNQTHLSPHIAFDGYGDLPDRVTAPTDSVRIEWSDYERQRTGPLRNFSTGLAVALNKHINLGLGLNYLSGETQDLQRLSRLGNFDLVQGIQIFRFSYDTLDVRVGGTSDFSATSFNFGVGFHIGRLSIGANLTPGYTLKRKWDYVTRISSLADSSVNSTSGEDKLEIPFSYSLGFSLNPHDKFRIAFDIEHKPYAESRFAFSQVDSTFRNWTDQTTFRVGLDYRIFKNISLLAGYRIIPQVFIPDGAAVRDRGPELESYTLGASWNIRFLRFDAAYEIATLKYYDVYFSNTNYAFERLTNLQVGVTLVY